MRERLGHTIREFLASEAAGGIVLMVAAALALVIANSPLSTAYFSVLKAYIGGLSVLHWINDGLMAVFFLLVGLEIKREMISGELSNWGKRALPGLAALGGILLPALIYLAFNPPGTATARGWAIPTATDIAFALGVLTLLGPRVPVSLKVFLAALAIIDDLAAVLVIALFYTDTLSLPMLAGAAVVMGVLALINRRNVAALWPYLALGAVLWVLVLNSGVHATIAGVVLAMAVPLRSGAEHPPLIRLEHGLHRPVAFAVVPVFGFANAGVSFAGIGLSDVTGPLPLGIALGLFVGKQVGVMLAAFATIRLGLAPLPEGATMRSLYGVALLTGIGFTMSLFIGLLAFPSSETLQNAVKLGVLLGSLASGLAGYLVLRLERPR